MGYQKAFPLFPEIEAGIMKLLTSAGFTVDQSWGNDACPSFQSASGGHVIYVDHPDKSQRENAWPRFNIYRRAEDGLAEGSAAASAETHEELSVILATHVFTHAMDALRACHEKFQRGDISSVAHAADRESALSDALNALAIMHGVRLQQPLHIDANGEFSIVAMPLDGRDVRTGCGQFGQDFSAILTSFSPRTGIAPGAIMTATDGWCRMNHFGVEKMLVAYARGDYSRELDAPEPLPARPGLKR